MMRVAVVLAIICGALMMVAFMLIGFAWLSLVIAAVGIAFMVGAMRAAEPRRSS